MHSMFGAAHFIAAADLPQPLALLLLCSFYQAGLLSLVSCCALPPASTCTPCLRQVG